MKYVLVVAAICLFTSGPILAQGVQQSPTQTVTQQRQNGALVNGAPSGPLSTTGSPTSTGTSTFNSPFASQFGTNNQKKGGYVFPQ